MTPKEIMQLSPESRLALEARARVGDNEAVRDFVLFSVWRSILGLKHVNGKDKVKAFLEVWKHTEINVEPV